MNKRLKDKELIQKLWQAFRIGQSTYIAYAFGLVNFTLILYRLGGIDKHLEPLPFAIILVAIVLPVAIAVGVFHLKKQTPVENKILTHKNPYIYKIVKDSKESMAVKTTLWNFDVAKVSNNFILFQADMNKKLWSAINEMTGKEVFTKEDMNKMDEIKDDVKLILKGVEDWKPKYEQLYEGKETKDIEGAENPVELKEKNEKHNE